MSPDSVTIAKRYSKALFELAVEKDQLDPISNDLLELRKVFTDNPQLGAVFSSTELSVSQKQDLLKTLTDHTTGYVKNFVQMLYDYQRMTNLVDIVEAFEELYDERAQTVHADVISAVELTSEQSEQVAAAFAKRVGAKTAVLNPIVDPSIIGGVIIRSENQTLDGSVRTQFERVRRALVK